VESWRPKGTEAPHSELRDCLRAGAYPVYGNGVSILGLKGDRPHLLRTTQERIGVRCYSTTPKKAKGDLPRKFEKLVQRCAIPKDNYKVNDIYPIMFNTRMYEVAYQKLKSNPGNMTPGIIPTTLDGFSLE
jgi:hypothetical protein